MLPIGSDPAKAPETAQTPLNPTPENTQNVDAEKVLCPHCLRTATNGIKCKGICVADNGY